MNDGEKRYMWNKKAVDKSIIELKKDLDTSTKQISTMCEMMISYRHKTFSDRIKVIRNESRKMVTYYRMMYSRQKRKRDLKSGGKNERRIYDV